MLLECDLLCCCGVARFFLLFWGNMQGFMKLGDVRWIAAGSGSSFFCLESIEFLYVLGVSKPPCCCCWEGESDYINLRIFF